MSNNTKAISFWNFLKENTIGIPIIQRDYAQGRLGKETLRKNFLRDLKNALDKGETIKLDFVYGSTENDILNPLDGQQRLTTLWLLHWYIALRAGELSEDNCMIFKNLHTRHESHLVNSARIYAFLNTFRILMAKTLCASSQNRHGFIPLGNRILQSNLC